MASLDHHGVVVLLLSLSVLLATARLFGELARHAGLPAVLGELVAGILLGPTVLGRLAPSVTAGLFPATGPSAVVIDGLKTLAICLFLLVAGIEVDLSTVWRQGRAAAVVSAAGIVVPFASGLAAALAFPRVLGREQGADPTVFALFVATAMSISALPVIVRTLMDLHLYRTDLGMTVVAAATFNDVVGWIIFAVILGMIGAPSGHGLGIPYTITMTLLFAAFVLTVGRWLIHRLLPWLQAYASWPGAVLGFAAAAALLGAAITEWIGVHALFGAFLVGVAIGDSSHLREHTRTVLTHFISFIFAPLFFASIGLHVDFIAYLRWDAVLAVLLLACAGKVLGCSAAARIAGLPARQAWAIGFGMNARGAMEIILGSLALQAGVIRERLFVALVIMAMATSVLSGLALPRILRRPKRRRLADYLNSRAFLPALAARTAAEAIEALSDVAAPLAGASPGRLRQAVLRREETMSTALGDGVAVPHARIEGLAAPVVAIGLCPDGIDFDAPDGQPVQLIVLLASPADEAETQLELLHDIAAALGNADIRNRAVQARTFTEFLAALRTA